MPEFILLVTQRITKYPVLLERILHYTPGQLQRGGKEGGRDRQRERAKLREREGERERA